MRRYQAMEVHATDTTILLMNILFSREPNLSNQIITKNASTFKAMRSKAKIDPIILVR
jgi:hypothetical protein